MTLAPTWFDGPAERTRPRLVLIATSLGVLFAQIDTSVVNLALKSIGADLHAVLLSTAPKATAVRG